MRKHLTFANVCSLLALFVALGTGAAYAANTVFSTDIVNGEVKSPDIGTQQVRSVDVMNNDIRTEDVADDSTGSGLRGADIDDDSLTGADIADQSGVDTCVSTTRIGQLCFRAENFHRSWLEALTHCANLDLRLPTIAEALELAQTHDLPGVDQDEAFWTSDRYRNSADDQFADAMTDNGQVTAINTAFPRTEETVCVTTPTN
jgi:hypothetical protein